MSLIIEINLWHLSTYYSKMMSFISRPVSSVSVSPAMSTSSFYQSRPFTHPPRLQHPCRPVKMMTTTMRSTHLNQLTWMLWYGWVSMQEAIIDQQFSINPSLPSPADVVALSDFKRCVSRRFVCTCVSLLSAPVGNEAVQDILHAVTEHSFVCKASL